MNRLTVSQIRRACRNNKYLLLRFISGHQMGINTKVSSIGRNKLKKHGNCKTNFIGYQPCSFHEYINKKRPYL